MIRQIFNFAIQNNNFIMFITSLVYIMGLFAYFTNYTFPIAIVLSIFAVFLILKNFVSPKLVFFWVLIFYFGFLNPSLRLKTIDNLVQKADMNSVLEGQIVSIPNSNFSNKSKFFFQTKEGKTFVTVNSDDENFDKLKLGNFYKISGKLKIPFGATNPSQFDYGKYLSNYNVFTVFYADIQDVSPVEKEISWKWKFLQGLNDIRNDIIESHQKYLKSPNIEIIGGIVFGDDAVAPPDYIKTSFIHSGLLHILAASGMNVAFIYGFWFFILRRLFKCPFKLTVISGMGVVILYCLMTGLGASVIRATIMILFILFGKLIDRDTHSVALLSLVAMLMLIFNPAYINDVGFQLSFLVTFGLLTSAQVVFEKCKSIPNWLSGAIFVPIIAQIWVAPLQMFYFNSFSLYSVFANITITPILSIVSFGGFMGSVLAIIKPLADYICLIFDFVLNPFISAIVLISEFFSKLPHSLITTPHPSCFQVILYYSIILLLTLLVKVGFKNRKLVLVFVFSLLLLIVSMIKIPDKNLEITAFAMQNADSFLIKSPENKYFIIDTGKSGYKCGKSQAEIIVLKYLKDNRIKNIENMIITHFDNDHSGGAIDLYKNLKIKSIYVNSFDNKAFTSLKIYRTIPNLKMVKNSETIYKEKDFSITTYFADIKNKDSDNENSIITLVEYKDFKALFMGDAGVIAFNKLKKQLPQNIDVLKVGHHGAKNVVNKEMIEYLSPEVSVISVGKNMFNHPNIMTLNYLRNTKILRTDKHNSIRIKTDGMKYDCFVFNKNNKHYEISKSVK